MSLHSKFIFNNSETPPPGLTSRTVIDYLIASGLSLLIYCAAIFSWGPAITNDSVDYMAAALSIREGMLRADGTIFYQWPPLYPILLSPAQITGINVITYAAIFNGLVLALNITLSLFIARSIIKNKIILLFLIILLCFSIPLIQIHIMVWSEPFFITLVLINIIFIKRYFENPDTRNLLVLIFIGILLFLQRKSGFIFSGATLLFLIFHRNSKFSHWIPYLILCFIPVILWFQRKVSISGKYFGHSELKPEKFFVNIEDFSNTFTSYFFPMPVPLWIRVILLILLFIILVFLLRKKIKERLINFYLFISVSFIVIYYVFIITGLIYIQISEEIDDRILIPVYSLVLICLSYFLDKIYDFYKNKIVRSILIFIIFSWLVYPVTRTVYHVHRWNTQGSGGYNTKFWNENEIISKLEKIPRPEIIYTNNVNSLFYHYNLRKGNNSYIRSISEENYRKDNSILVCFYEGENDTESGECENYSGDKKLIYKNTKGAIWAIPEK